MAAAVSRGQGQFRPGSAPKLRTTPAVCLHSQVLIKIPYDDLGPVLRSLGVDGCDLSVMPDGHINPAKSSVDMMRGVEAITGVGLDVPCITTAYTSLADPTIRNVMAICGEMGVPVMRTGAWKWGGAEIEQRLAEVQRDLIGLMSLARAVNMSIAIPNLAGEYFGAALWDTSSLIRGMDARTVGYAFDPAQAAVEGIGLSSAAFRMAALRIKMLVARDVKLQKDANGTQQAVPCPLGEGVVEWPKLFAALARIKFAGPVSIHIDHQPSDELAAIRSGIDFIRKQIRSAYNPA